jgi:hypothetical protein
VSYHHGRVSFPPQCLLSLLAAAALVDSIVGRLLCRSPLSIDLVTQPPPASAFEKAMISAPDLSCNKRACKEDTGSDSGHVEEDRHSPWVEPSASEARAEESAGLEAPANAISSPTAATEADPMPAREITPAGLLRLLLLSKMPQQGMTLLLMRPLTRPAKKARARPHRKQRKRPRCARGHCSPQSRLLGPLPAPGSRQACRLRCLHSGQGLA